MNTDLGLFQSSIPSTAALVSARVPSKHHHRGLSLAVGLALGGTLALGLSPAAVAQRFPATLPLSSLDGTNGFKLDGEAAFEFSGRSVSAAGDIYSDGIDDVLIGARYADPNGGNFGRSYVGCCSLKGFTATLPLSSLNGTNGFKLDGETVSDQSGRSVSAAGDVNSDGIDDLIIGAD